MIWDSLALFWDDCDKGLTLEYYFLARRGFLYGNKTTLSSLPVEEHSGTTEEGNCSYLLLLSCREEVTGLLIPWRLFCINDALPISRGHFSEFPPNNSRKTAIARPFTGELWLSFVSSKRNSDFIFEFMLCNIVLSFTAIYLKFTAYIHNQYFFRWEPKSGTCIYTSILFDSRRTTH